MRLGATHPALGPRQGCQRWAQSSPERWIVLDARILCEDDYSSQGCIIEWLHPKDRPISASIYDAVADKYFSHLDYADLWQPDSLERWHMG